MIKKTNRNPVGNARLALLAMALIFFPTCQAQDSFKEHLRSQLEFSRGRVLSLLEEIEKTGQADRVLNWQAKAGRAPIGWQLMHIAASEDGMASGMIGKQPVVSEEWSKEFRSFKELPESVPTFMEVRKYLTDSRQSLEKAIDEFSGAMDAKPNAEARFDYGTAFKIIQWHEPHHHGQAHATFNLWKSK